MEKSEYLISELEVLKLSKKVKEYIKKIDLECFIRIKDNPRIMGANVILIPERQQHKYIKIIEVEINEEEFKNESQKEIDYTIAHELTHEFLSLKRGYCRTKSSYELSKIIEHLVSMIEDVVVDNIIQENDFYSNYETYINNIRHNIKFIHESTFKDKNYFNVGKDEFRFVLLVSDYILAYNYIKYSKSDKIDKKTLYEFLETIQEVCPKQYEEAKNIENIITKNDIFTSEGYNKTIKECLKIWNLIEYVKVYTCISREIKYLSLD